MNSDAPSYYRYRFPADIIAHAVWLYFRFGLSFRDVEDLLAQRGVLVSYETIRQWALTFGRTYARRLRRRRGQQGDTWHPDELFISINGRWQYLWRAVDEDGDVLDVLVQSRHKSSAQLQRFVSIHGVVQNLFRVGRHLVRAVHHRLLRTRAFSEWDRVTCAY